MHTHKYDHIYDFSMIADLFANLVGSRYHIDTVCCFFIHMLLLRSHTVYDTKYAAAKICVYHICHMCCSVTKITDQFVSCIVITYGVSHATRMFQQAIKKQTVQRLTHCICPNRQ